MELYSVSKGLFNIPIICMYVFIYVFAGMPVDAQRRVSKPNIIFILVDDQGYGDVGSFFQNQRSKEGKPYERSPNLDRLSATGAMLMQQYAAAPVCAPSRASIMLGVSQGHANVRDNQFDKAIENNYTMPSTLKRLGYSTAVIGKWGLQGDARWDKDGAAWPAVPRNRGFDYFFGYMRHSDEHQHCPKEGKYTGSKQVWDNGRNIASELDKCYTADLWTAAAKHWITDHERGKDRDKPFFMYLAYDTPHAVNELPTQPYPSGGGLDGGMQWIGKPGHFINTASGKIDSYIDGDYANATYDNDNNPGTPEVPWPDTYKRYAMANRRMDDAVGDLVKLLQDLRIDSNTVIVYTSDNGPSIETYLGKYQRFEEKHLPIFFGSYGPFDGIKRDNWEGGVRMPAIARWPGHIPGGKKVITPNISFDWAPTFIDMAGEVAPARMDGVSLVPSLTGNGDQRSSDIYIEYYQPGKTPNFKEFAPNHRGRRRNQMQLLRLGDYAGVRYDIKSANDSFEIYNVVKDPQERNNLALKPNKKVRIEKKGSLDANILGKTRMNGLETYIKARVLQVRHPDPAAPRPYDSAFIPPVKASVVPGVNWKLLR
jgi:arylsulfatase A-like enzyme